ncbi:MAG: L-seryl-tRNA(Sec) selenium transferase [Deltaproteobacteria bacterium]|nr:L-seryl-tRNA(Sec) selenium transferase [Deltaproteobacteria bacterium]
MDDKQSLLRKLPKIDALLARAEGEGYVRLLGRRAVADLCRAAVDDAKSAALAKGTGPDPEAIGLAVLEACRQARSLILGRVVNGTGVLLHTNLGRAPLGAALFDELRDAVSGYCNLEIDVLTRSRGRRGAATTSLLAQLAGAQDALVVNNNAAVLFLVLREFAAGREVIISRSELVQIGGGFRIPDILGASGAALREVGTTNITTLDDYRAALGPKAALVLKVHQANFRMEGFVEAPDVRALKAMGTGDALLVSDLGSGNPARGSGVAACEPTPADMIAQGADLVCFSGDKMLGGVQAGVVAGRRDLVARLSANPLMRVLRVDKIAFAAMGIVLRHHLNGEHGRVAVWALANAGEEEVRARAESFIGKWGLVAERYEVVPSTATFGGGSTPGQGIPSFAMRVKGPGKPDEIARFFQEREPPVIGTVRNGSFEIDFRTVLPEDEPALGEACRAFQDGRGG